MYCFYTYFNKTTTFEKEKCCLSNYRNKLYGIYVLNVISVKSMCTTSVLNVYQSNRYAVPSSGGRFLEGHFLRCD